MKKRTKAEGQSTETGKEKGTPWIKRHGKAALAIALVGALLVGAGGDIRHHPMGSPGD